MTIFFIKNVNIYLFVKSYIKKYTIVKVQTWRRDITLGLEEVSEEKENRG